VKAQVQQGFLVAFGGRLLDAFIERPSHDVFHSIDIEVVTIVLPSYIAVAGMLWDRHHFLVGLLIEEIAHCLASGE
jgi:hypothetical protein